jgi:hypothetical protein
VKGVSGGNVLRAMLFGRMPMSMLTGIHAGEHGTRYYAAPHPRPLSPEAGERGEIFEPREDCDG